MPFSPFWFKHLSSSYTWWSEHVHKLYVGLDKMTMKILWNKTCTIFLLQTWLKHCNYFYIQSKVFITFDKHFQTDFNTCISYHETTNMAWDFPWCDASDIFQSKFNDKILCWCPLPLQFLGQLNDDLHESQWYDMVIDIPWNLHRLTFCPHYNT